MPKSKHRRRDKTAEFFKFVNGAANKKASEAASEADRIWFAKNPHRTMRARHKLPGEFPAEIEYVVVKQFKRGFRSRFAMIGGLQAPDFFTATDGDLLPEEMLKRRFGVGQAAH
jgi:hypothetical protein